MSGKILLFSIVLTLLTWLRVVDANFPDTSFHMINDAVLFQLCLSLRYVKVPAALCYLCIKMHHGNYVKHLTLKATVVQPVDYFHTTSQLTSLRCYNVVRTLRFGHANVVNNVVSMFSRKVFLTCTQRCQTTFHITFSQPSCNIF